MRFSGQGVLLDIEGTTSSISYVFDVMFPFVRRELPAFLAKHFDRPPVQQACRQLARDDGCEDFARWCDGRDGRERVIEHVGRLMDRDSKQTGLKELQGIIWEDGFASGELQAHVFDDVPSALRLWNRVGLDVRVYSSGSVRAQKLFFSHTRYGDLLQHFSAFYDTTTGPKREARSYRKIVESYDLPAESVLFVSDVVEELDAARAVGMKTALVRRTGNPVPPENHVHCEINSFAQILVPAEVR